MVIVAPSIFNYFFKSTVRAFAFYPFIILKNKEDIHDDQLLNHEKIHLRQQLELFVIPFYVIYFGEFLFLFVRFRNWEKAYRSISFEKEAYTHHANDTYLNHRRVYSMWR